MKKTQLLQYRATSLKGNYYVGIVVNNKDKNRHKRIQVQIKNLTDKIPRKDLPFYSLMQGVGEKANTLTDIPPIGSRVTVYFPEDDILSGLVTSQKPQKT